MKVPERLAALGQLFEERNKLYGDNYKNFGKVMIGLFPKGVNLATEEEFNRFCLFVQIVHKVSRYAQAMRDGHADSLDDLSVYAQMLQEYDYDSREDKSPVGYVQPGIQYRWEEKDKSERADPKGAIFRNRKGKR